MGTSSKKTKKKKSKIVPIKENGNGTTDYKMVHGDFLPEDKSYLGRVNVKEMIEESQDKEAGRALTHEERLIVTVSKKNDAIKGCIQEEARLTAQIAELTQKMSALKIENTRLRTALIQQETEKSLAGVGMVPGHPLTANTEGELCFRDGYAPEDVPAYAAGGTDES